MGDTNLWINVDGKVVHPDAPKGGSGQGHCKSVQPLGSNVEDEADVPHPFSPVGRNTIPDRAQTREILELDASNLPDPRPSDEVPTFNDKSPVPTTINADTVDEFVAKSNAAMGDGDAVGHMVPEVLTDNIETDSKGNVLKANMVVNTKIVRPRVGLSRNDTERALMKQAEALIMAHEQRHRSICVDFMTRACRAMRGQPGPRALKIVDEFIDSMNKAQAEFDSKEGMIFVDHNGPNGKAGPATGVRVGPPVKP